MDENLPRFANARTPIFVFKLTITQSIDNWKKSEFKNYFYNIWFNSENKKTCLIINFLTHLFLYPLYIQCRLFISKNFCILYCGLLSIFSVWSFFCLSGCYIIVYGSFHTKCRAKIPHLSDFPQILWTASFSYKMVACKI